MTEESKNDKAQKIAPSTVLSSDSPSPLVLMATLAPVAGMDRFQPAGFPEVGHVIYKAPRKDGSQEHVCILDSAASMANHLESVCMRGPHDPDLVADLEGMPYLRCVTGPESSDGQLQERGVVVTSLTEGHRIASSYFLLGEHLTSDRLKRPEVVRLRGEAKRLKDAATQEKDERKKSDLQKQSKEKADRAKDEEDEVMFQTRLAREFGLVLAGSKKAHPPFAKWWDVFKTIFKYDPNALVHGVMFPQWQVKIPRILTAHLEAFGAARVDRSGVKFDRLGKTTSGQPIFAVDDATARQIRATFVLDVGLVRSLGRQDGNQVRGLTDGQKRFLVALALWKIQRLLSSPFRFRSGCHLGLEHEGLKSNECPAQIEVDITQAIRDAGFTDGRGDSPVVTDIYWPLDELYREGDDVPAEAEEEGEDAGPENDEGE